MRFSVALVLASVVVMAGCGQLPTADWGAPAGGVPLAARALDPGKQDFSRTLARFSQHEGRRVTARHVPMNEGRGAAELVVPLSPEDQTLLVQLYRLHARPLPGAEWPAGLVERASEHLTALHGFKKPDAPAWTPERVRQAMRTRCYRDGDGEVLAYESYLVGEDYMMFGKYDLKGRILKIDIETWTN